MLQPVTRRAALRGAAGGLVGAGVLGLSGCGGDLPDLPSDGSGGSAGLDPDEGAVLALVDRLTTSTALLAGTGRTFPLLRAPLAPTLAAERAHLATLLRSTRATGLGVPGTSPSASASASASGGAASLSTRRAAALAAAQRDTRALRAAYVAAAQTAESGSFARLLASMGCSLSQRLPGMVL